MCAFIRVHPDILGFHFLLFLCWQFNALQRVLGLTGRAPNLFAAQLLLRAKADVSTVFSKVRASTRANLSVSFYACSFPVQCNGNGMLDWKTPLQAQKLIDQLLDGKANAQVSFLACSPAN